IDLIKNRMKSGNTLFCCGLDPDINKLPIEITEKNWSDEKKVLSFMKTVVDITVDHVCAFKAQKAFFDLLPCGHNILKELIAYIHGKYNEIPVIVDCKIGDIGNTMEAYNKNLFNFLDADGVVINPYMGDDVFQSLKDYPEKAIVVLVKTSNLGGGIVQNALTVDWRPVWQYILKLVVDRWNEFHNLIPVLSSTEDIETYNIRSQIPDEMLVLLAGAGAQGGNLSCLSKFLNKEKGGVIVNSSRQVLYPVVGVNETWQSAIKREAIKFKEMLNNERGKYE
ncbi:MAG: orotidine-5'-phosphate decarboxylase, partial [Bacteroidota bacterium]